MLHFFSCLLVTMCFAVGLAPYPAAPETGSQPQSPVSAPTTTSGIGVAEASIAQDENAGDSTEQQAKSTAAEAGLKTAETEAAPSLPASTSTEEEQSQYEEVVRRDLLPSLDVYLPEGTFDLRLSRLVRRAFVEGQIQYNFIEGDISAYLRYRYYARNRIHQFGVFDEVAFSAFEKFNTDFSRTRGVLFLTQFPVNFHQRVFILAELDRINSNKEELFFNNNRTNTFLRVAYQLGTPQDRRSNAIVGENRAEVRGLFSAFRKIGPGDFGVTTAATWGSNLLVGDFDYLKLEFEALKRFRLPGDNVLIGRLHSGTFLHKEIVRDDPTLPLLDQLSIPRTEYFRLDGRQSLKGLSDRVRGTEEIHTTWEFAFPWFRDSEREALKATWNDWYWVLYSGYGNAGFDREIYGDFDDYLVDAGFGFEAALTVKGYQFFLSGIVAKTLNYDGSIEARLSVKTYR